MEHRNWIAPTLLGVSLVALWWFVSTTGVVDSAFLPTPQGVVRRLVSGLQAGYLLDSLWITLGEALLGCLAAAIIGIPIGYGIAHSRVLAASLEPYLAASQAIPAVAIAPLLVLWVGRGTLPIVILCTIMVIFPIVVSTAVGIRQIDPDVIGAARLDGANGYTMVRHIEMPMAAPNILAGLRTGFTLSITGAVVGEMIVGGSGLAMQLVSAQGRNDVTGMFAVITLLAFFAIVIYVLLRAAEVRVVAAVSPR